MAFKVIFVLLVGACFASAQYSLLGGRNSYIFGGEDAKPGQFPYYVSLRMVSLSDVRHSCGGALVSDRFVLTSANCLANRNAQNFKAFIGAHSRENDANAIQIKAKRFIVHEEFSRKRLVNDIGLIELDTPVVFNDVVKKVKLGKSFVNNTIEALIPGFGKKNDEDKTLKFLKLKTMTNDECRKLHNDKNAPINDFGTLCAYSGRLEYGICKGDSGSPLVVDEEVIGVASWSTKCARGVPDGFTRVSEYVSWIEKHIQ